MALNTITVKGNNTDCKQGRYGNSSDVSLVGVEKYKLNYNKEGKHISQIEFVYKFGSSGSSSDSKRLYYWNGDTLLGYKSGKYYNNTATHTFTSGAIFNGLVSMIEQGGTVSITHKEDPIRGWIGSGSTRYSTDYLRITSATITVWYEDDAYLWYGDNGEWVKCAVYYGAGDEWHQCVPYFGQDRFWIRV